MVVARYPVFGEDTPIPVGAVAVAEVAAVGTKAKDSDRTHTTRKVVASKKRGLDAIAVEHHR